MIKFKQIRYENPDLYQGGFYELRNNEIFNCFQHFRYSTIPMNSVDSSCNTKSEKFYSGKSLFVGYMFEHFGHFIFESIPYLQYIDYDKFDHIVAVKIGNFSLNDFHKSFFAAYSLDINNVEFLNENSEFESVMALPQRYGYHLIGSVSSDLKSDLLRTGNYFSIMENNQNGNYKKVYVSKSKFSFGSIIQSDLIDSLFIENGYEVYYPELHSISHQIQTYKNAEKLVFCESTALHLLPFINREKNEIAVIVRRNDLITMFSNLLNDFNYSSYFTKSTLHSINFTKWNWEDVSIIDINALSDELFKLGYFEKSIYYETSAIEKTIEEFLSKFSCEISKKICSHFNF
jgi:hypothetical protein